METIMPSATDITDIFTFGQGMQLSLNDMTADLYLEV